MDKPLYLRNANNVRKDIPVNVGSRFIVTGANKTDCPEYLVREISPSGEYILITDLNDRTRWVESGSIRVLEVLPELPKPLPYAD